MSAPKVYDQSFRVNPDHDLIVWRQVVDENEYRIPDDLTGKIVVDIGASIGDFSWLCLSRGASRVIAFEPCDRWRAMWRTNCEEFQDRSECHGNFVCGKRDGSHVFRYPGDKPGEFSTDHWNAPTVAKTALEFDSIAAERIDLLKIDCEGAEYSILGGSDLGRVQSVVGEAHRVLGLAGELDGAEVTRSLLVAGFKVEIEQTGKDTWLFWGRR